MLPVSLSSTLLSALAGQPTLDPQAFTDVWRAHELATLVPGRVR